MKSIDVRYVENNPSDLIIHKYNVTIFTFFLELSEQKSIAIYFSVQWSYLSPGVQILVYLIQGEKNSISLRAVFTQWILCEGSKPERDEIYVNYM